jgi:hypothetical protein
MTSLKKTLREIFFIAIKSKILFRILIDLLSRFSNLRCFFLGSLSVTPSYLKISERSSIRTEVSVDLEQRSFFIASISSLPTLSSKKILARSTNKIYSLVIPL